MAKPQLIEELLSRARRHPTIVFTMIDLLNAGLYQIKQCSRQIMGRGDWPIALTESSVEF